MTSSSLPSSATWSGPRFSPAFVQLFKRALLGIAIFHLVAQWVYFLPLELARTDKGRDATIYYDAAVRLKQGVDVYQLWPDFGVQMAPGNFFYSPPFLLLVRPLGELSYSSFIHLWLVLILLAFWGYCFCLSRIATGRWEWKAALIFGLLVNCVFRGHDALSMGQFEPFMWLMFGLALTTRQRGGWLALATLVKIHPIWSLSLALGQGGTRAWKSAALFAIPVLVASLWLVGFHNWAMWWPATQPIASQGTFDGSNWSLSYGVLRLCSHLGWLVPRGNLPGWAKAYLSLCALVAPLGTMFLARKRSPELRLALVASASILFAPLCWYMYFPLLLLPVAVWLGEKRVLSEG